MKLLSLLLVFFVFCTQVNAQKKGVKKGGAKKGAIKGGKKSTGKKLTSSGTEFEELTCYLDGPCTFSVVRGDTLIFNVAGASGSFDLNIIPIKFVENVISDFNWTTSDGRAGHITISTQGLKSSKRYLTMPPTAGELKLNDASFLWFCGDNFTELTSKKMKVGIDNNLAEDFFSPEEDAISHPIIYKGKPFDLDGFIIQNKELGTAGRKEFAILNISNNLLIFKADYGNLTMTLKEVREKRIVAATVPVKKKKK